MLDESLVERTKKTMKVESTSDLLEALMREHLRKQTMKGLAELLRNPMEDDAEQMTVPARRRAQ